jgi:flagellar biosynthetic protein FliR
VDIGAVSQNAQLFLLIFSRIFALLSVAPLLSSSAIPGIARLGLSLFSAAMVFPWISEQGYPIPPDALGYTFLMVGEILIGIVIGFILTVIYSGFQVAGQYFSFQMGFGASQVYDPMAQVEIPLMGQFLNIIAMFVFLIAGGFQKLFLVGILRSFQVMTASDLITSRESIIDLIIGSLTTLFQQALIISFPILGTLLLISVTMGLLAKAAPQMNLLMLGFPIQIGVAFMMIMVTLPLLMEAFSRVIDASFLEILRLFADIERGGAA